MSVFLAVAALAALVQPPVADSAVPNVAGAQAPASDRPSADTSVELTPEQMFALGERLQTEGQDEDAIGIYRALRQVRDPKLRQEARFRLAMLLRKQGRLQAAALELRAMLDAEPDLPRVRLELANILAQMGDTGAARRELRAVLALDLPPQVANTVTAISDALRARKHFGASFEFALAQDSNINRATRSDTLQSAIGELQLSEDAQATSGIGASIDGFVYYRQPLSQPLSLLARLSTNSDIYEKSDFNDMSLTAEIGPEIASGRDRISLSAGLGRRWYGGDLYSKTIQARATFLHPLDRRSQLTAQAAITDLDNRFNDLQSGMLYYGALGYERALSARAGAGVTLFANRQSLNDPGYSQTQLGVNTFAYRELGAITATLALRYSRLRADARLALFTERRRENRYYASLTGTFRQLRLFGFAPFGRVGYERNQSSVALYDFDRVVMEAGVTRAF